MFSTGAPGRWKNFLRDDDLPSVIGLAARPHWCGQVQFASHGLGDCGVALRAARNLARRPAIPCEISDPQLLGVRVRSGRCRIPVVVAVSTTRCGVILGGAAEAHAAECRCATVSRCCVVLPIEARCRRAPGCSPGCTAEQPSNQRRVPAAAVFDVGRCTFGVDQPLRPRPARRPHHRAGGRSSPAIICAAVVTALELTDVRPDCSRILAYSAAVSVAPARHADGLGRRQQCTPQGPGVGAARLVSAGVVDLHRGPRHVVGGRSRQPDRRSGSARSLPRSAASKAIHQLAGLGGRPARRHRRLRSRRDTLDPPANDRERPTIRRVGGQLSR